MSKLKRFVTCVIFIVIMLAAFVFSINNPAEVPLWLGIELAPQRLGIWLIMAFAIGGAAGLLVGSGMFRGLRYRLKIRQLEKRLQSYEKNAASITVDMKGDERLKQNRAQQ